MRAILTFHAVDDSGSLLSISPAGLTGLVRGILASRHRIVSIEELLADAAPDRVALSFDDGLASVAEHALPLLRDVGARATLFLTTGRVGSDNRWPGQSPGIPALPMLDWGGVGRLAEAGWSIEAHSVSHADLRALPDAALEEELLGAVEAIAARVGRRPVGLAYPYGSSDARVGARAARHFRYAVTTRLAPLGRQQRDLYQLPRIDSYYLRAPWLQRHFGGASTRGWLALRALARRARGRD